jgi:hypothetical protein
MSHFTRIKTQIVELEYLKRALADLKYEYEEGSKVRGFGGQRAEADLLVKTKGYPIGFKNMARPTSWSPTDWWGVRRRQKDVFAKN